jgi:hypothetical protein
MKKVLFVLCILATTAAFGQSSNGSAQLASSVQFSDHFQQASPQPISDGHNLLGFGSVYSAKGEMPLSEVHLPPVPVVPLGDVARAEKKEHAADKKAQVVWEN